MKTWLIDEVNSSLMCGRRNDCSLQGLNSLIQSLPAPTVAPKLNKYVSPYLCICTGPGCLPCFVFVAKSNNYIKS